MISSNVFLFFFLSLLPQWVKQDGCDSGGAPKEDRLCRPEFARTGDTRAGITSLLHRLRAYRLRELTTAPTTVPISSFTVQFPPWMFPHTTLSSALWLPSMHVRASYEPRDTPRPICNRLTRLQQIRYEVWLLNKKRNNNTLGRIHSLCFTVSVFAFHMWYFAYQRLDYSWKWGLLFLFITSMFGISVCSSTSTISHSSITEDVYSIFILS